MGSGGIRLGSDWDLSGTAGPLGTARDRGTAWDRSGPLRTAGPDWWDWVRSVGSAASAVGSAAERCWGRQPLEMKRGPGAAAPGKESGGPGAAAPGKEERGPGAAAPGIDDISFIADTFIFF